jgi:carbamoyl-phosphate synthase large subunit
MVAGADGSCRGLVAMRKLAINQAGQEVCGAVVEDPRIWKFARDILERLDWRGPLLLDLVRLPGETQPYLRDIDYRFPPWIVLTHWAKCNLPVILLEEILGGRSSFTESGHAGTLIMRSISETAVPFGDLIRLQRKGSVEGPMKNGGSPHPKFRNDIERIAIKVAITGTSTFDMINPGLGVARALRQAHGISRVYGLNYGTFESGSYQADLFDASFRLPITGDAEILLQRLQEIHQNHPFDVLLPCLDGELPQFISLREEIEALGVRTILPPQSAFDKRSKLHLFGTGIPRDWIGFEIPESYIAFTEEEVVNSVNSVGLPAVVKGPLWGCIQVDSLLEARVAWNRLLTEGVDQAVVQPMIAGAMFAVAVVCNRDSEVLTTLTVKKLARCGRGSTWSALQVQQPQLEASFAKFLQEIGWVGPAEGEFIRDDIRDRFYLLEVNPRFTGWISYSGALGSNHPYIAVRAALGDELDLRTDPADLVFMRSSNEITVQSTDLASLSLKGFINNVKR